jgi:Putative bacterial sensory transduction regulator
MFGTHHAAKGTIDEVGHMVEHYYKARGLDPKQHEIEGAAGCGWWLTEGSARIYIFIQDAPGGPVIRITSPIVTIPQKRLTEFYRHLLDINATLTCCALSTSDNAVLVVAQRHTAQLDQEEVDDMVWNVAYVADLLDDKLVTEYGARTYQI